MNIETFINEYRPCNKAVVWLYENKIEDMNQAWQVCKRSDWMMWTLKKIEYQDNSTLINLACDFAEHVLPIFERAYPNDIRPRDAIQIARDVAAGKKPRKGFAYAAADAAYAALVSERTRQANLIRKYLPNMPETKL